MPQFSAWDEDALAYLVADFGAICQYRRAFADAASPSGWLGPGPAITTRPVGARDAADWDPVEQVVTDSTQDAATGYAPAYAPAQSVAVLLLPPGPARVSQDRFGLQAEEGLVFAVLLARDMTPARGDLIVHPNGSRYVVGDEQTPLGTHDAPLGYRVQLQRRQPGDPVFTV